MYFRHIGGTSQRISRSHSESNSANRKETTLKKKKSVLRLKVDVHIDDDGKCVSLLGDKNDEVELSKSNFERLIELKCHHSNQTASLHEGTIEDHLGLEIAKNYSYNIFSHATRLDMKIHLSFLGGDEVIGCTDNAMNPKTEKVSQKIQAMDITEEKHQYQKPQGKSNLNFGTPNIDFTSTRRASKVEQKASGESSIEVVQDPNGHTKLRRNSVVKESKYHISNFQQYSKTSTEFSHEDECSTNHFRKLQSKSTLILSGIVLIFLFCNIPRLGVKIFHICHQGRSVQKHFNACAAAGQYHAPVAIVIMGKMIKIYN